MLFTIAMFLLGISFMKKIDRAFPHVVSIKTWWSLGNTVNTTLRLQNPVLFRQQRVITSTVG